MSVPSISEIANALTPKFGSDAVGGALALLVAAVVFLPLAAAALVVLVCRLLTAPVPTIAMLWPVLGAYAVFAIAAHFTVSSTSGQGGVPVAGLLLLAAAILLAVAAVMVLLRLSSRWKRPFEIEARLLGRACRLIPSAAVGLGYASLSGLATFLALAVMARELDIQTTVLDPFGALTAFLHAPWLVGPELLTLWSDPAHPDWFGRAAVTSWNVIGGLAVIIALVCFSAWRGFALGARSHGVRTRPPLAVPAPRR